MVRDFVGKLCDFMLPRHCRVCGTVLLEKERHLCTVCISDMPLTYFWIRLHNPMADALNGALQRLRDIEDDTLEEHYSAAAALYFYKGGYKKISQDVKYNADIPLGQQMGQALGKKLSDSPVFEDADLVVPVPLHWLRRWKRGYNQSCIIAEEVASALGAAMDGQVLRKQKRTRSQTGVTMADKANNVRGAFKATPTDKLLSARHILIIDDVFTSGSTVSECHRTLRKKLRECLGEKKPPG